MKELPQSDLQEILLKSGALLENFREANILILGPNGFIGNWLRQGFLHLDQTLGLNIRITGIVRNTCQTLVKTGGIYREQSFQSWHNSSQNEVVTHVFHCATKSRDIENLGDEGANEIIDLTANTIQRVSRNAVPKFIHLSSGAVYGESVRKKKLIEITTSLASWSDLDLYGRIKLKIENLVHDATERGQIIGGNPRLFSFYGPGLNLDAQFAISSFVKSAQAGNQIQITGNPATERTYMYPTDLVSELIKCADSPTVEPTHLGGAKSFTMHEIANEVAKVWNVKVEIPESKLVEPNFYNPEVSDITDTVSLPEGLLRWKFWLAGTK